jgi:hypothetical protein
MTHLTTSSVHKLLTRGFGEQVFVRARRPGLFQIDLPTTMADGDGAMVFMRAEGRRVTVSDLGHTLMRLSYTQPLNDEMERRVAELANTHGFALEDGQVMARVELEGVLAAAWGISQVQAEAEASIRAPRVKGPRVERFRSEVLSALESAFAGHVELGFFDEKTDPEGLYRVDAVVRAKRDLPIFVVANDIEAERAVATQFKLADEKRFLGHPFVAITRDVNRLRDQTRKRLMQRCFIPLPVFSEDVEQLHDRLERLAG